MTTCPRCSRPLLEGARFCAGCGAPVAGPSPGGGAPVAPPPGAPAGYPPAAWTAGPAGYFPGPQPPPAKSSTHQILLIVLIFGGLLFLAVMGMAAIMVPNFVHAQARGQLAACQSNLRRVGTALEMYATDNEGQFPTSLDRLTPDYLKSIPTCPAAGNDTYTGGYQTYNASSPAELSGYTVVCSGSSHTGSVGLPANFPQYTSTQGLIVP